MTGERDIDQRPGKLTALMERGFEVARDLRSEAKGEHAKGDAAQTAASMSFFYGRSQILELTADNIQEHLSFLKQRLVEMGPIESGQGT